MAAHRLLPLCVVAAATTLVGCTETLRVPPPKTSPTGVAGTSAPAAYVPSAPATGAGLVAGSGNTITSPAGGGGESGRAPVAGGSGGAGGPTGTAAMPGSAGAGVPPPRLTSAPWIIEGHGKYTALENAPIGVSRDGNRVLESDGTLWIDEGTPLPTLIPTIPGPVGISADGSSVFGAMPGTPCPHAAVWTAAFGHGLVQIHPQLGSLGGASANGKWFVGNQDPTCHGAAFTALFVEQTPPGGYFSSRLDGDDESMGLAVSADGSKMIGFSWSSTTVSGRLFSWTLGGGPALALHDDKIQRGPFQVQTSADGSVVVGTLEQNGGKLAGFVTTPSGGLKLLPAPPSRTQSLVSGVSVDGSIVLALATSAVAPPIILDGLPFTWSAARGSEALAIPSSVTAFGAVLMTPDASLIVGSPLSRSPPIVWDNQRVPRLLFDDAPSFAKRCQPTVACVSADGKTFAGSCGNGGGFVARF